MHSKYIIYYIESFVLDYTFFVYISNVNRKCKFSLSIEMIGLRLKPFGNKIIGGNNIKGFWKPDHDTN